jgi:hypothetical protein
MGKDRSARGPRLRQNEDADAFCLDDIDRRLLSPKTNDLAEEMHKRASEAERRIQFETAQSGNTAGYLPRWFDFQEQLTEEWAKRLYAAYCKAWTRQNRSITAAFIRVVRDRAIAELIAARKSSVRGGVVLRAQRTGQALNATAFDEWARQMDRLSARWNRRLEAEAVVIEYRAAKLAQVSQDVSTDRAEVIPNEPDISEETKTWRRLHEVFMALSAEELRLAPNNLNNLWLRASVIYEDQSRAFGQWLLSAGVNEGFKARFEVAATGAGIVLGTSLDPPLHVWLHHLFQDLLKHKSKLLFTPSERGGIIVRVCEASAIYSAHLERVALESGNADRVRGTFVGTKRVGSKRNPVVKPGPALARPNNFVSFAGGLWREAIAQNRGARVSSSQLQKIASSLDNGQYVPPAKYLEKSCANQVRHLIACILIRKLDRFGHGSTSSPLATKITCAA